MCLTGECVVNRCVSISVCRVDIMENRSNDSRIGWSIEGVTNLQLRRIVIIIIGGPIRMIAVSSVVFASYTYMFRWHGVRALPTTVNSTIACLYRMISIIIGTSTIHLSIHLTDDMSTTYLFVIIIIINAYRKVHCVYSAYVSTRGEKSYCVAYRCTIKYKHLYNSLHIHLGNRRYNARRRCT